MHFWKIIHPIWMVSTVQNPIRDKFETLVGSRQEIQTPPGSLLHVGRGVPWQACRAGDCVHGVLEAVDRSGSSVYSGAEPRY